MNDKIILLFKEGASHTKVATELGITRTQYNSAREANPKFNRLCEMGDQYAQIFLEDTAIQGARGELKNFNTTMTQFLLKTRFGEIYSDKRSADDNAGGTLLEQLTAGSQNNDQKPDGA